MDQRKKKKIAIVSVCSLILVAMVVALVIGGTENEEEDTVPDVSSSQKAISSICETTDYQQTCMNSLAGHNSTNPKDLIEVAFQAAVNYINQAAENSSTLQHLETDPMAKSALQVCQDLANRAINDLQRSFAKFSNFDIINVDDILLDLKIWLSGAITHQETCLDGFEDVPGESGQKMKDALKISMELTSNALAMVAEISTFLEAMGMQSFSGRRRLLSEEYLLPVIGHGGELPDWADFNKRKLLTASPKELKPDLVVAKDGSGKYRTINEALKDIPKKSNKTFVLYIKEGVYEEKVQINSSLTHLMMVGDGPTKTRITGHLNFIDGTGTYQTATVAVQGDDFIAKEIGFENSAGAAKHQAVALRVSADKSIFYNCHMDGYQDTLYVHTYRQFYKDCVISGTVDFIFGDSAAVFQGCTLVVRKPMDNQQCIVTAQGRKDVRQPTGIVIQNCSFVADPELYPVRHKILSYLGRPWKEYSRTIIMESFLDDFIQPDGWMKWNETFALETLFYTEFNNRGPAAPKMKRVKWPGVKELPPSRVQRFTPGEFLDGNRWIPPTQVPYAAGFIFPVPKEDPNVKYSPVVPEENKDLGKKIDKTLLTAAIESSKEKEKEKENNSDSSSTTPPSSGGTVNPMPVAEPLLIPQPVTEIIQIATPPPVPVSPPPPTPVSPPPPISIPESEITSPPSSSPTGSSTSIPDTNADAAAPQSGSNSQLDFDASAFAPGQSNNVDASSPLSSTGAASPISIPQSIVDESNSPTISPMSSSDSIPQSNEAASPPTATSASVPQSNDAAASPPTATSASAPQSNDAAATPPTTTSASVPPSNDAAASPPTATSASAPQSNDAAASPPTATSASVPPSNDAAASPPTATSAAVPPSNDAAASPPTATSASVPPTNDVAASPPAPVTATSASVPQSNDAAASPPAPVTATSASVPQSNDIAASPPSPPTATSASAPQANDDAAASPTATATSVSQSDAAVSPLSSNSKAEAPSNSL
ncbi:PREDICTED: probable pectinesterase/pectinesterase inhibitor 58 [Erythranthe guttata]|nr:PREDICTED: probable pectinesterase/pectinesterase inhibitor 58 [Erythranthe guttata]|eukprot:XP_012831568.1 PREDICTED: probable pectinesterase/pectinesterase inhibitor 58 [Erythranthe guttata]